MGHALQDRGVEADGHEGRAVWSAKLLLVSPCLVLAAVVICWVELGAVGVRSVQLALGVLLTALLGHGNRVKKFFALAVVEQGLPLIPSARARPLMV
jgi:hypothetical protein